LCLGGEKVTSAIAIFSGRDRTRRAVTHAALKAGQLVGAQNQGHAPCLHSLRPRDFWAHRSHFQIFQEITMNKQGMPDAGSTGVEEKVDSLRDTVKGLVDQGAEKVDAIKSKVVEAKDQAINRGGDMLDRTTDMIKANPIKSVAIAFAAGYIGMRLFRR
jgi:ElaB/YqjD/DUF883 family membrane-anchored ribosome-binding protein